MKSHRIVIAITVLCSLMVVFLGCSAASNTSGGSSSSPASSKSARVNSMVGSMSASAPFSNNLDSLESSISDSLAQYDDKVAVTVATLNSSGFSVNGSRRFVCASMIKLLILAEFMEQVDKKIISLEDRYALKQSDVVGGTGVIADAGAEATFTYDELAMNMIAESDNTATNILIDILGMDSINDKADELGLSQTLLQRKMMDADSGKENYMSANDAAIILDGIARQTIASAGMCQRAEEYLLAQTDDDALVRGLPDGMQVANKTGSLSNFRHDAGIVLTPNPYIIAVFTEDVAQADALIAKISKTVYEELGQ